MNYEKKYKDAFKWAESIYPELNHEQRLEAEAFFPELAKSEGERIRKELLSFCESRIDYHPTNAPMYGNIKKWIAWLEKQKPAWSEEDEETVTGIINDIQERLEDYPTEQLADIYFKEIKWLKSIKERIGG